MNMRTSVFWLNVIVAGMLCLPLLYSCKSKGVSAPAVDEASAEDQAVEDPVLAAVDKYLVDEIGSRYSPGEVCIPCSVIMDVKDSDDGETLVSGSFWVFNYVRSGDTLKTVSGGHHPGIMHVRTDGDDFKVASFDAVGDGSDYLPSARRLFGDRFDAFQELVSDDLRREAVRSAAVTDYVRRNKLPVTMYQDFGWDPVRIGDPE